MTTSHLGFLVRGRTLGPGNYDVRYSVSQLGRTAGIPLLHLVGQLDVRLLARIVLFRLGELFRDDELRDIDAIAEQVRNVSLRILHSAVGISLDEDLLQTVVHESRHQLTVVPSDSLDSLAIHLVVLIGTREVEAGVAFLVDQQVRIVYLLELELDGLHKLGRNVLGCLSSHFHGLGDCFDAKLDHDGVCVSVDDDRIVFGSTGAVVFALDLVLCKLDHHPSEGSDALGDLKTR